MESPRGPTEGVRYVRLPEPDACEPDPAPSGSSNTPEPSPATPAADAGPTPRPAPAAGPDPRSRARPFLGRIAGLCALLTGWAYWRRDARLRWSPLVAVLSIAVVAIIVRPAGPGAPASPSAATPDSAESTVAPLARGSITGTPWQAGAVDGADPVATTPALAPRDAPADTPSLDGRLADLRRRLVRALPADAPAPRAHLPAPDAPASRAARKPAAHSIPADIEGGPADDADPLDHAEVDAGLQWLEPDALPLRVLQLHPSPDGGWARLAPSSASSDPRGYVDLKVGDVLPEGWMLVAVSGDTVTLLSPRGNPVRLAATGDAQQATQAP